MKRIINYGSLAGIVVALILLAYAYRPPTSAEAAAATAQTTAAAFNAFPAGQPRLIDLEARREALEDLRTERERLDQMRDWLLFTAVSASGLSAEEINKSLFDVPPIRHAYVQPVANFEYGDTRACYIGGGQVIALVPANKAAERGEQLARIADEQRKNLGELPARLWVFEYDLRAAGDAEQQTATLTRRDAVEVKDLFTPAAGYSEAKITSLDDLKRFMTQVDDLTYASLKDGLTVGGRKVRGHDFRGIRVEDIAALFQSEAKIRATKSPLDKKIDEFNARWSSRTYRTQIEKMQLEQQRDREEAALKEEIKQAQRQGQLADGSGFSLDPTYDFEGLLREFDEHIAPLIRRYNQNRTGGLELPSFSTGPGGLPQAGETISDKIAKARAGLERQDADPLFELLGAIEEKDDLGHRLARFLEQGVIHEKYSFQHARYDGELQGTEAGMVLFYTDLLAKLWAINYQNSTPAREVADFRSMTALPVATVYKKELEELSNTRLWFGPQDRGFQVADKGQSMLFARTATRVYAASSNSLKPGIEAQANAHSSAFLGWWDNHYDEIARYEPEYERLNEIMKWSLVVGWLHKQGQAAKLNFLQSEHVEHGNWFPDWVRQHPQLRFHDWERVGFYPRGYKGTTTEALPRLYSASYKQFGADSQLSGGVSLASETTFESRVALSAESEVAQVARRSNLDYGIGSSTNSALKTFEGTSYSFRSATTEQAFTTATAKEGAKLRGTFGEIANRPFERTVAADGGGLSIGTRVGEVPLGELKIGPVENGFRVGWESRDLDAGQSLAHSLSASKDPAASLARAPGVEAAFTLTGARGYLVKLEGAERWLRLAPEETPTAALTQGFEARVGDLADGARNYNLSWLKAEEVQTAVGRDGTLVLHRAEGSAGYRMELAAGRRTGGQAIELKSGDVTVRGTLDAQTHEVAFALDELPKSLRDDPSLLRRLVADANPTARNSRYVVGELGDTGLWQKFRSGDYQTVARDLVNSPAEFKARLDAQLRSGLGETKELLRGGQYEAAAKRVDQLIEIFGPRDELRLHKAVAQLGDHVPEQARASLGDMLTKPAGERARLFDEINARLRDNVPLRPGESLNVVQEGEDLALRYAVSGADGVPLAPGETGRLRALVYVEDKPGLNTLDWHVSVGRTLDGAVAGDYKVVVLPRDDVAGFRPTEIFDAATGTRYKAVNEAGTGRGFRTPRVFSGNANDCADADRAAGRCRDDANTRIVLVRS